MAIIQFKDVWEMFRIKFVVDGKASWENFWALKSISFEVNEGECLGIIGENGAGKSTILKLIAGMLKPDRGEVNLYGRVAGLLELGAGFQPELTGRDNIYLNASLFGLTKTQIEEKYEDIMNFACLGKFINAPVKCYSQGMFVRLAFAIAIHMDPEILLIDDTLAVGDESFQRKCIKKIFELKEKGKTIILVTHDMGILRRLCKRAIFLQQGMLIEDDSIDKIIPIYTQMIGPKGGIGILGKEPLRIIFNNGRLFLNWRDKLLTPNLGIYTEVSIANKHYNSSQADWEVIKEGEDKLVAKGKFFPLALTQTWMLQLADNHELKWDVAMELAEPLEIKDGCANIMLTNEYSRWFTTFERGRFHSIDEKSEDWQVFLQGNVFRKSIGAKTEGISGQKIPSLVFEQFGRNQAQILNTDCLFNSRVLRYKISGLKQRGEVSRGCCIHFSGKISLNAPNIDSYLGKLEDEFILSNKKLKLAFDNGRCILQWDGVNLTKGEHIYAIIFVNDKWYLSNSADWKIEKKENNRLIAMGSWPGLPLVQIWEIELSGESRLSWKINMQVNKEIDIREQMVQFFFPRDYEYWISDYGRGNFPVEFLETELDILQRCVPSGTIELQGINRQLPAVSLRFAKNLNNFAKIFNSDFHNRSRILRIERVEPEKAQRFSPGEYQCFAIELSLDKIKQMPSSKNIANVIESGRLKFVLDKGSGRIYWKGEELTKRLGLYTSLRSQGRWHDSASSAMWKIEKKNGNIIEAIGEWQYLPVRQHWEIKLREEGWIDFRVKMNVDREIIVDRLQANLMLLESYAQWLTNKEEGAFPFFRQDTDDDWDRIWSGDINAKYIGVLENASDNNCLPTIKFCPQVFNPDWAFNILNSDIYHRGRVLQYLNAKDIRIIPGEYPFFIGSINIKV